MTLHLHGLGHFHSETEITNKFLEDLDIGTTDQSGSDDFYINATEILSQTLGVLIWGSGAAETPFMGGTLCLLPPVIRSPSIQSGGNAAGFDCSGVFRYHFSHALVSANLLQAGATVYAQFWYRDPLHPDGTGAGLSDALAFTICP